MNDAGTPASTGSFAAAATVETSTQPTSDGSQRWTLPPAAFVSSCAPRHRPITGHAASQRLAQELDLVVEPGMLVALVGVRGAAARDHRVVARERSGSSCWATSTESIVKPCRRSGAEEEAAGAARLVHDVQGAQAHPCPRRSWPPRGRAPARAGSGRGSCPARARARARGAAAARRRRAARAAAAGSPSAAGTGTTPAGASSARPGSVVIAAQAMPIRAQACSATRARAARLAWARRSQRMSTTPVSSPVAGR